MAPASTITTCIDVRALTATTSTPPPSAGVQALLSVRRTEDGHVVERLRRGARLAPRVLELGHGAVQACVLPTQAGPLAGDHDRVRIVVGSRATLVVRPIAATLALPGAARTRLELEIEVGPGARLVLEDPPLIVATGADVERTTTVTLAAGAVAALRESAVLGRAGEPGGRLVSTLRVTDDGGVVLHDALILDPATSHRDAHVALPAGHRVAATLYLLGIRAKDEPQFALARVGALRRASATGLAELETELAQPWSRWAQAVAPGVAP
ncbi:MAG: urease accessory protein [Solirubrobacteraceae bacterium]|jgi:urease accessory protein|nr:urease accessory protein [Solirubrobacteraceae bacterium]